MPSTERRTKLGITLSILLWVAALGVLAENIALLRQNQRLREAAAPQITAGTQLRMLSGLALSGRVQNISLPSRSSKLLIITFSPLCPECQANQEGWMKLASTLEQKGLRVLWVSRDSVEMTTEYCLKHGIPLSDTVADPPFRTYLQLGLARVPNTVLLGSDGKVERVWVGGLDKAGWNSVFSYFGERHEIPVPIRSEVGALTTGCGPGLSEASAKSCK